MHIFSSERSPRYSKSNVIQRNSRWVYATTGQAATFDIQGKLFEEITEKEYKPGYEHNILVISFWDNQYDE